MRKLPLAPRVLAGLSLAGALLPSLSAALPSPKGDEAVFAITQDVKVKNPPRFGVNFDPPAMSHWSTEPLHNQWWNGSVINPFVTRFRGVATGGSASTLEHATSPRLGYWDVFRDGYFEGGECRVYRFADGKMTHVRTGKIAKFQASKEGPNVLTFAEPGPEVKAGDDYFIDVTRTDIPVGMVRPLETQPWRINSSWVLAGNQKALYDAGVRVSLSPDAPADGGGASLALTIPAGLNQSVSVGNWLIGAQEPDWPRLHAGKTYTVRLALKQTGMAAGAVTVNVASVHSEKITVGGQWQTHTFDFVGAPPKGAAERFEIVASEPGTLLVDNVTIVEKDGPADFGFYPHIVDTLKRFRPSTLRLWNLHENVGSAKTLDAGLFADSSSPTIFDDRNGSRAPTAVGLHECLVLCAQVGTDPWIITSVMFTEQEQKNLVEYLAGPADSPYGKKRAARGQVKPWTEVFGRIKIEVGNETWNGMFGPQGFGVQRVAQYGAWSEVIFQAMKSSPYFKAEKFQFVLNGWVAQTNESGYGAKALAHAPSAQAVDIAYYTGGWDAVGLLKADSAEEGWMNILTYSRRMLAPRALEAKKSADAVAAKQGRPGQVETLVYEAGPGYTLPAPGKFNMAEQIEGKSIAQAINSLDIFMTNLAAGYGDQSFFTFKNGHYWSSHNRAWDEQIAWKALGLRNNLLRGDLITAKASKMVTLDLPETQADVVSQTNSANKKVRSFPAVPNMPLIDCYPFRDGNRYSYMLISRRLDGPTQVTLELPYEPKSNYTLHALVGDTPSANNIEKEVVSVQTQEREGMTRRHTLKIPAHSVLVLVTEAK